MTTLPEMPYAAEDGGIFHAEITTLATTYIQTADDPSTQTVGPTKMLPYATLSGPAEVVASGLEAAAALIRRHARATQGEYR